MTCFNSRADIEAFRLVGLHTVEPQCDVTWRVTKRRKGDAGVKVTIPCTLALRSLMDSLPRRGPLIFTTATGRAWQKRYVARHFETARAKAAEALPEVAELHFHDTRGTAITILAEAGASVPRSQPLLAIATGPSTRFWRSICLGRGTLPKWQ